jgi:hypothetical protein
MDVRKVVARQQHWQVNRRERRRKLVFCHRGFHVRPSVAASLWSALKLNFAEWQQRAVSRRLERTAADIEASRVFWHEDVS